MRALVAAALLLCACGNDGANQCTLEVLNQLCQACHGPSDCGNDPLCENGQWSINCRPGDLAVPDLTPVDLSPPPDGGSPD
jgi:hypothetical protein